MSSNNLSTGESLVMLLVSLGTLALEGVVVMQLWRWFVVPLGVTPIGYWHGMGLSILASQLTHQHAPKPDEDSTAILARSLTATLLLWGLGALAHGLTT